jgi:hypothetical protein
VRGHACGSSPEYLRPSSTPSVEWHVRPDGAPPLATRAILDAEEIAATGSRWSTTVSARSKPIPEQEQHRIHDRGRSGADHRYFGTAEQRTRVPDLSVSGIEGATVALNDLPPSTERNPPDAKPLAPDSFSERDTLPVSGSTPAPVDRRSVPGSTGRGATASRRPRPAPRARSRSHRPRVGRHDRSGGRHPRFR